jgi:hypothetical protein
MFEKLFVKTSDLVFHTIAPYAVERERFLEHCCEEGFSKTALRRIAGIVVTAACDLHAHGGLDVDQRRLEAAAARIEVIRGQAGTLQSGREFDASDKPPSSASAIVLQFAAAHWPGENPLGKRSTQLHYPTPSSASPPA